MPAMWFVVSPPLLAYSSKVNWRALIRWRFSHDQISRVEALRLYTEGAAWFSFDDHHVGSFVEGKYADLAVLSDDYLTVPDQMIRKIESVLTLVGGKIVHVSGSFAGVRVNAVNFPASEFAQDERNFAAAAGQVERARQIEPPSLDRRAQDFTDYWFVRILIFRAELRIVAFDAVLLVLMADRGSVIIRSR